MLAFETVKQDNPRLPQLEAVYFRSYGIHSVEDAAGPIHIFSFPDWPQLQAALESDMPSEGTIVTPECASFTDPHDQLSGNEELIAEREALVLERSRELDGEIWLGTLSHDRDGRENPEWRNQVITINNGEIVAVTNKQIISAYEYAHSPVRRPDRNEIRPIVGGRAGLICLDLIGASQINFDRGFLTGSERTILAPTCWAAVPEKQWGDQEWLEGIGGMGKADDYFKGALEGPIATALHSTFAEYVIVADANVPGTPLGGPFNAIFRRVADV